MLLVNRYSENVKFLLFGSFRDFQGSFVYTAALLLTKTQ